MIGSPAVVKILIERAISKGARFVEEPTEIEPPPAASEPFVFFRTEGKIDDLILRGIAKIAFNYLAKIQGGTYVLDEKFDRIRKFIKGEFKGRALVRVSRRRIIANEIPGLKTSEMHLVLFERQNLGLVGRLSLFNSLTYDVILCPNMGLIYSLKSGHAFDPVNKQVHKLAGISPPHYPGFLRR